MKIQPSSQLLGLAWPHGLAPALAIALWCCILLYPSTAMAQRDEPATADIQWATEAGDGVLVGLKLLPSGGVVEVDQPLQLQFVIKNTTAERKRLNCVSVSKFLLDLRADNVLQLRGFVRPSATTEIEIDAGQVLEPTEFRTSISTEQMLPGEYTIDSFHAVWATRGGLNKEVSLGTLRKVAFSIVDHQAATDPRLFPPEQDDLIHWGEPIMGLSLGAQLIRFDEQGSPIPKSQRFHLHETLTLQLFLHNQRDSEVELEIPPPRTGDPWELSIFTEDKKRKLIRQMNRDGYEYRPWGAIELQPGEQTPLTGVAIAQLTQPGTPELNRLDSVTLQHAGLDFVAVGERRLQNPRPLLEVELGNYFVTATAQIQLSGTNISAAITSGRVPFRVVDNPLKPSAEQAENR